MVQLPIPWQLVPIAVALPVAFIACTWPTAASIVEGILAVLLVLGTLASLIAFPLFTLRSGIDAPFTVASKTFTIRLPAEASVVCDPSSPPDENDNDGADAGAAERSWPGGAFVDAVVYYPSDAVEKIVPYMSVNDASAVGASSGIPFEFIFSHLPWLKRAVAATNSSSIAPQLQHRCPLVLFSHGLTALPINYWAAIEGLVKLGCVVVAPTHGDGSAACCVHREMRGDLTATRRLYKTLLEATGQTDDTWRSVPTGAYRRAQLLRRAREAKACAAFVLREADSQLGRAAPWAQLLDADRGVSYVGHSFGGATAVLASANCNHASSAVAWDAWLDSAFPVDPALLAAPRPWPPSQFLVCTAWQGPSRVWAQRWVDENHDHLHELFTPPRTGHHNYNDFALIAPRVMKALGNIGAFGSVREPAELLTQCILRAKVWIDQHAAVEGKGEGKREDQGRSRGCDFQI